MTAVTELIGVYHASGTLWGELSYWVGARLGRAHCSLCDVTHGTFRRKRGWSACEQVLPVPFVTYHLNDRPADVAAASGEATPCVLARTASGELLELVGPVDLEACGGDPEALVEALGRRAVALGLDLDPDRGPEDGYPAAGLA